MSAVSGVRAGEALLPLGGKWRFALDRDDKGIGEQWFNHTLEEEIQLPGALQNQGFGDDISVDTQWTGHSGAGKWRTLPIYTKYREPGNIKVPFFLQPEKHYVGTAWYQRDVEIPADWLGRRVVLTLGRPHWATQVWLDDRPLGTNVSLFTPHVYDMGIRVTPGRHRLTVRVDNRLQVDIGERAHSVSDESQGNWNGIIGELKLSTTTPVWIENVQTYPDVSQKTARLEIHIGNSTGKSGKGILTVGDILQPVEWSESGGAATMEVPLGTGAQLWDEFHPELQHLVVKLAGNHAEDEYKVVFGLREIKSKDRQFLLNGRPIFLRGTLECCVFPLTGYPPTDVESWKRILNICRAHGLNHIRFHSWCPPEAAFVAADELGFYYQIELAWNTKNLGDGSPLDQWLYDEGARVLKTYGNHPSFMFMPYGNEPGGKNLREWFSKWVRHWKETDPRRLYTTAAGWSFILENQYNIGMDLRGPKGWFGLDYRDVLAKQPLLKKSPDQPSLPIEVPFVVHEMGQWCVYPDFDEMSKYTGPLKPKNFEIFRDSLAEHGMSDQWKNFFMASGKLQVLCYKEEIEAALRTPGIGGIQLLDLHDFPGQGTALVGVLDPFWDSKPYATAAEYRRFYNTTVPLARLLRRTWTTTETLTADVEVAHYGETPLVDARPYWKVLAADGHVVAGGELPTRTIPFGSGNTLGKISLPLDKLPAPEQYKLVVGLEGTPFENDWNFWVYPDVQPAPPADVLMAQSFDENVRKRLAGGGKVLLASGGLGFVNSILAIHPIFWNRYMIASQKSHTLGLLCDSKHPALAQFPTDFYQDWQWNDILTSGHGIVMDTLPRDLKPIVQPIDDWNTNRKFGLLFECRVGKGKLLVCTADLTKDPERRPAARQLRNSLLAYAASDAFDPKVEVPEALLEKLLETPRPSTLVNIGAKVIALDSKDPQNPGTMAIDGDPTTFWRTEKAKPMPHFITIDLGREMPLRGLDCLPRQDEPNGRCLDCEVYATNNPGLWGDPLATIQWKNNDQWQTFPFGKEVMARYLKIVVKSAVGNTKYTCPAEFDIVTTSP